MVTPRQHPYKKSVSNPQQNSCIVTVSTYRSADVLILDYFTTTVNNYSSNTIFQEKGTVSNFMWDVDNNNGDPLLRDNLIATYQIAPQRLQHNSQSYPLKNPKTLEKPQVKGSRQSSIFAEVKVKLQCECTEAIEHFLSPVVLLVTN